MSFGRYLLLKMVVGLILFCVSVLPTFYLVGLVAVQMPKAATPIAFALAGLVWLIGMMFGTHFITEKLSKRWSH
ncbi:hypothetical protein [Sphingopyxis sp.]|uniref:hypothetical protein n=1 Tax=Sphingopyxis sp. TaxID=1908224 RepID=UPI002623C3E8|nr:hypothetical protein [Sphingopyxis sp.]MCW0196589.1 hypothetical protein [Sphingopyxis sp.]